MVSGGESHRVLVVDDEARLRRALVRSLSRAGYEALEAVSGEEALSVVAEGRVDLVITDLMMPGMDGLRLVGRLSELAPEAKVIMMTAYGSAESLQEAERLGVSCYLAKPFDLSHLKSKVHELVGSRPVASSSSGCPRSAHRWRRGGLRFICSSAGRGLGAVTWASCRVLQYVTPRYVLLTAGRVTGAISGFVSGIPQQQEVNGQ